MKAFFTQKLLEWHQKYNKRALPWKGEKDAYKIWLSEIILQQTRAEQGLKYYLAFVNNYPTVTDLANAPDNEVFKLWEGLGYYSRCKNLLFTARYIRDNYNGCFPKEYENILALKGVGNYTAAAIASFAYNLPYAVVDGNVYRVLSRFYNNDTPIDSSLGKNFFSTLAQQLLPIKKAATFNQAIMDFGATICTPKKPLCEACNLNKNCEAIKNKTVDSLPKKAKKIKIINRFFYFFIIEFNKKILIEKRVGKDIWQNLHQFLVIEKDEPQELNNQTIYELLKSITGESNFRTIDISKDYKQTLTHQKITARFIQISFTKLPEFNKKEAFWVNRAELKDFAFPQLINQYIKME